MRILSKEDIASSFNRIDDKTSKSMYVYHLDLLDERIDHLKDIYPENVIHAVAIKSNNLPEVLKHIVSKNLGLEAASFEEVELAIEAGCEPSKIVFDSPVKTIDELEIGNNKYKGLRINANSFYELDKLSTFDNLNVGVRINPMLKIDSPDIFMVSGKGSKFGIPITEKPRLLEYIKNNKSIKGLHIHPGSEIASLAQHVECIKIVYDFANEINRLIPNRINWIDIGGGIKPEKVSLTQQKGLSDFMDELLIQCPFIFDKFEVITEYGRFVHTYCAYAISKVEDILDYHEPNIALIHLGADLFLREVYSSSPPPHGFYNISSVSKSNKHYDIGGPLCFSGDFLAKNERIEEIEIGDMIAITDCGSNSISMWSSHCSRNKPNVVYLR